MPRMMIQVTNKSTNIELFTHEKFGISLSGEIVEINLNKNNVMMSKSD